MESNYNWPSADSGVGHIDLPVPSLLFRELYIDIGKSIILLDDCMISYTVRIHNKINHQFEFIKDK